jgi:hypothetical protein
MPSRLVSLGILIYWSIAAFLLLTWEVIPELTQGYAPDLRALTVAGEASKPVRWSIEIVDNPRDPESRRPVGESVTASQRRPDGWLELTNHVELDASGILKDTPFANMLPGMSRGNRLRVESAYLVDNSGNLSSLNLTITEQSSPGPLLVVRGKVKGRSIEIVSRGKIPMFDQNVSFDYEPRSVVQDVLGPMDRLPGLHVGQRWESRVINPFTRQAESVRVEVTRRGLIHWDGNPVTTFEVVHRTSPFTMKTWVRTDGVILRQEIPLPFVRLVLERRPETDMPLPITAKSGNAGK